jgi:hypothetical protein
VAGTAFVKQLVKNPFKHIFGGLTRVKRTFRGKPIAPMTFPPDLLKQFEKVAERFTKAPEEMKELSTELAKRGWYTNLDMPIKFLYTLRSYLREKRAKDIDKMMIAYIRIHFEPIENEIMSVVPPRAEVLSAAFRAHMQKAYTLSVPVFLAQADGICSELLGVGLYSRTKGIPKTAPTVEQFKHDEFISAFLEPLRVAGALNAYEDEKHQYPDILNRHEVLHGKSLNYATELNSFRAISLLSYLCSVVKGAFWFEEISKEPEKYL